MPDFNDKSALVTKARQVAREIVDAVNNTRAVLERNNKTATLDSLLDVDEPIFATGSHQGLTKAEITNLFSTFSAVIALYDSGHGTNLEKVAYDE